MERAGALGYRGIHDVSFLLYQADGQILQGGAKLFNSVQKAEVSWKRIQPLMKKPEELPELDIPAPAEVTLKDLSFAYGSEPVFSGLSMTAQPGDIIGVTGPVACGKSTFGRVFSSAKRPYGGSARFGREEFSALTPRQIAATVGYLGHDPELSADTVRHNVLCGSEVRTRCRISPPPR